MRKLYLSVQQYKTETLLEDINLYDYEPADVEAIKAELVRRGFADYIIPDFTFSENPYDVILRECLSKEREIAKTEPNL